MPDPTGIPIDKLKITYSIGTADSLSRCANKIARRRQVRAGFVEHERTRERHAVYLSASQDQRAKMKARPEGVGIERRALVVVEDVLLIGRARRQVHQLLIFRCSG